MIFQHELITDAGNIINEDLARIYKEHAWVLDGSSGLSSQKFTSGITDAIWFVEHIDNSLQLFCDSNLILTPKNKTMC